MLTTASQARQRSTIRYSNQDRHPANATAARCRREYLGLPRYDSLIIAEAPELEFSVLGTNTVTNSDDEGLVFYDEVSKVHVLPDERKFTIQVITPDLELQMDFPDTESVSEALKLFELKKVAEVHAEAPGSVRLMPVESEPSSVDSASG